MTDTNLIKQKFKSSIQRGTGEAHLLMQNHPDLDFTTHIIKACIKNFAYDGQCEYSRGAYLFELIELSGRKDKIRDAIYKALLTPQKDTWTLTQLFELALMFAKQGDGGARQVIYDAFVSNPIWGSDWAGTAEMLELDGLEGLKFIAEEFGKRLDRDPEDWQDDELISQFQKDNPETDVWARLDAAGAQNRFIKGYTDNVRRTMLERATHSAQPVAVYNDIVEEVLLTKGRFKYWRLKDDEAGLILIAQRLVIEKDKNNLQKLLTTFARYKFPLDGQFILNLARHGSNKKIRQLAVNALQFLQGEEIRQFAMDSIATAKNPEDFVIILRSNYKTGDSELLTQLVEKCNDQSRLESLVIDYQNIYWANETPECREPLEALYNKHTCGMCRELVVEILIDHNVLSGTIKDEIRFDCREGTRKLYKELI